MFLRLDWQIDRLRFGSEGKLIATVAAAIDAAETDVMALRTPHRGVPATPLLVTGGDHTAVQEVLADPRLRRVDVVPPWLPVPDPRRGVLEQAIQDAASATVEVLNA